MNERHFMDVLLGLVGFAAMLALLVGLRIKTRERFEVKNPDIVLALIPIALWLLLTGKITSFQYGDLKIETAFVAASNQPVAKEVSALPVEEIAPDPKMGMGLIPQLIRKKSKALSFTLGQGNYVGEVIEAYLRQLTRQPFLRYIVLNNLDGTLFGVADARALAHLIDERQISAQEMADCLNRADRGRLQAALPEFVAADKAVQRTAPRQEVLQRMSELDVETLPVVSPTNVFVGTVERSRLSASMLIDIAKSLDK